VSQSLVVHYVSHVALYVIVTILISPVCAYGVCSAVTGNHNTSSLPEVKKLLMQSLKMTSRTSKHVGVK
jgi:hypothetical protein